MATWYSVNEKRERNWLSNALRYNRMKLFKGARNSRLWLFSAWDGQKYADNAKYFYEYMLEKHPEITCIWQTGNEAVYEILKAAQKPVQLIGTAEAAKAQREAGVVFYTNGLDDFGDFPLVYGAVIVSLWHGVGFKRIYREQRQAPKNMKNIIKNAISDLKWDFFSWVKRDVTIATSETTKKHFIRSFHLKNSDPVLITGQPRNDVFSRKTTLKDALQDEAIIEKIGDKRIVLYLPTFRKEANVFMDQLADLWKSTSLDKMLSDHNAILLTKLHYLNQGNLESTGRKILLNDADIVDTQGLMCCADILITDYSSCAIDFALQKKPTLFYFPDWEAYDADNTMWGETKSVCSINCAEMPDALEAKLNAVLSDPMTGLRQSEELNRIFDSTHVEPGHYSEKVYDHIVSLIREKRLFKK